MAKYKSVIGLRLTVEFLTTRESVDKGKVINLRPNMGGSKPNIFELEFYGRKFFKIPLDRIDINRLNEIKDAQTIKISNMTDMVIYEFRKV